MANDIRAKQYCRYCVHCHTGNGYWCDVKQREYSPATFKTPNNCKFFDYCEIDAFAENPRPYHPRLPYRKNDETQAFENMSLYELDTEVERHGR